MLVIGVFAVLLYGVALIARMKKPPISPAAALAGGSFILMFLCALLLLPQPSDMLWAAGALIAGAGVQKALQRCSLSPATRNLLALLAVCGIVSFAFIPATPLSQIPALRPVFGVLLGGGWVALIVLFRFMDKIPFLSMVTNLTWGLFFFALGDYFEVLKPGFGPLALCIMMIAMACAISQRALTGQAVLGHRLATLIGLLWGGYFCFLAAQGFAAVSVSMMWFYLLELAVAIGATVRATRRLFPLAVPFMTEQAWSRDKKPDKVVHFIFWRQVLVALLGIIFVKMGKANLYILAFVMAFVMLDTYLRLKKWGIKQPRFREILADIKAGVGTLKNEAKAALSQPRGKGANKNNKKSGKKSSPRHKPLVGRKRKNDSTVSKTGVKRRR